MSLLGKMAATRGGDKRPREKNLNISGKRMRELVDYARKNSPFYKELYAGIGEDFKLTDLPPVTKPQMMASFDDILTDRSISMKKIEEFTSDLDNIGHKIDGKYLVFKTSGSTGVPAVILYDDDAIDVSSAVAAFRTFARQEDFKSFMKHGKKTAGVFADYGFYLACGMSKYLQLKMPRQKTKININVNAPEDEIISKLNEFQPAMLSGYPSNLALLADFKELDIHPDVVITGGELLTDEIRNKLEKRFGCYVQTHYSCTEGGEIACECSERHLHINEDWIIFEPVDRDNNPVPCGVMSDKVLITNLANKIQPFIRYELTDRVIVHDEKCACGRTSRWVEIEGRTDDILDFGNGVRIAPMSLYKILEEVPGMSRFQLVQRAADKLELRLIADDKNVSFEYAKKSLTDYFAEKGASGIEIVMSEDLPMPDKVSGKFKHIYKDFV
ncbi:MAG: phenylacetate--CoA ligase family protein [Clostridiales bacterium]|nr:phenylacetate--CoA ligase family protein [Clostridiales bacterium]